MSNFRLDGKTAIITGAAGGLGKPMAMAYAAAGANVVVASRNAENIREVAAEIEAHGQSALAVPVDITDEDQVDALIASTVDAYGAVDVIVNNAGRWGRGHAPEDTPLDEWRHIVELNLTGCFLVCLAAGRQMIAQKGGKIINVSSTAGSKGNPGQLHYSAAKAGVLSLTNNLACRWARHNITYLTPGLDRHGEVKGYGISLIGRRRGEPDGLDLPPNPEDVANLALFLASPASDAISGELIPVRSWMKSERFWQ